MKLMDKLLKIIFLLDPVKLQKKGQQWASSIYYDIRLFSLSQVTRSYVKSVNLLYDFNKSMRSSVKPTARVTIDLHST